MNRYIITIYNTCSSLESLISVFVSVLISKCFEVVHLLHFFLSNCTLWYAVVTLVTLFMAKHSKAKWDVFTGDNRESRCIHNYYIYKGFQKTGISACQTFWIQIHCILILIFAFSDMVITCVMFPFFIFIYFFFLGESCGI